MDTWLIIKFAKFLVFKYNETIIHSKNYKNIDKD